MTHIPRIKPRSWTERVHVIQFHLYQVQTRPRGHHASPSGGSGREQQEGIALFLDPSLGTLLKAVLHN